LAKGPESEISTENGDPSLSDAPLNDADYARQKAFLSTIPSRLKAPGFLAPEGR
jgi:hypothetical protein